jgi:glutamate racemase
VPAIKPAAEQSQTRVIGVLGTNATVRQPYVDRLSAEFASDCVVLRHGSARLVELAEAKLSGQTVTAEDVAPELAGLLDQPGGDRMDMVVLACTHFPLLAEELAAAAPRPFGFIDGGKGIARHVKNLIERGPGSKAKVSETPGAGGPSTSGLAIFTRADPHVDALAPALQGFGLNTIEIL